MQLPAGRFRERRSARGQADAFLRGRGLIVRAVKGYGLPHCLRITIGTEEEVALVSEASPIHADTCLSRFRALRADRRRADRQFGGAHRDGSAAISPRELVANARTRKTLDRVQELGIAHRIELDPRGRWRARIA